MLEQFDKKLLRYKQRVCFVHWNVSHNHCSQRNRRIVL